MVNSSIVSAEDFLIVTLSKDLSHKKYIAQLLKNSKRFNAVKITDEGENSELSWMDYVRDDAETEKLHGMGLKSYISMQNGSLVHSSLCDLEGTYSSAVNELIFEKNSSSVRKFEKNEFFGPPIITIKFYVPRQYDPSDCLRIFFEDYGSADEFAYVDPDITDANMRRTSQYSLISDASYIAEICPVLPHAAMNEFWDFLRTRHSFSGGAQCLAILWPEHSFKFPLGRTLAIDSIANMYLDDDHLYRIPYIGRTETHEDVFGLAYQDNGFEPGDCILKVTQIG